MIPSFHFSWILFCVLCSASAGDIRPTETYSSPRHTGISEENERLEEEWKRET